jgi:hypothetical protein
VVGAIDDFDMNIDDWVTANNTIEGSLVEALDDSGDEILGNGTADCLVLDRNAFALFVRGDLDNDMTVLTASTGLLNEFTRASCGHG